MNIFRVFTTILYPFFIYLLLFSRKNLVESSGSPPNPSPNSKTGVDLSLKATASTDQFDHNKSGKIVTFTAKGNHAFKSVKTKNKMVWETTNPNEYSNKVVLDGKGQKNKKVTIHLPNNTTKVLKREGKGKEWEEVAQPGKDTAKVASTGTGGGGGGSTGTGGSGGGGTPTSGSGTGPTGGSTGTGGGPGSTPTATTGSDSTRTSGGSGTGTKHPLSIEFKGNVVTIEFDDHYEFYNKRGDNWSRCYTLDKDGKTTGSGGTGTGGGGGNDDRKPPPTPEEVKPENYPKEIKLFKADPNDATKTVELDISEYKVTKTANFIYKINDGVKCTLVQHENKDVWKFDSSGTGSGTGTGGAGGQSASRTP